MKDVSKEIARIEKSLTDQRIRYWNAIADAHLDYDNNENHGYYEPTLNSFRYWMERKWGIRVEIKNDSIGSNFTVVDEAKYTMFILRYLK